MFASSETISEYQTKKNTKHKHKPKPRCNVVNIQRASTHPSFHDGPQENITHPSYFVPAGKSHQQKPSHQPTTRQASGSVLSVLFTDSTPTRPSWRTLHAATRRNKGQGPPTTAHFRSGRAGGTVGCMDQVFTIVPGNHVRKKEMSSAASRMVNARVRSRLR